jgi:hypothetical protein
LLDSSPSPKKLPLPPKIHTETEGPSDTRKRKESKVINSDSGITHQNKYPVLAKHIEEGVTFWTSVIKQGGRGSVNQMRSTQKDILAKAVDEFLFIKYGDAAKFKRTTQSGLLISCIPDDAITQFNDWLDERIAAGKLMLSFTFNTLLFTDVRNVR